MTISTWITDDRGMFMFSNGQKKQNGTIFLSGGSN
jgi:hypothetical protein